MKTSIRIFKQGNVKIMEKIKGRGEDLKEQNIEKREKLNKL